MDLPQGQLGDLRNHKGGDIARLNGKECGQSNSSVWGPCGAGSQTLLKNIMKFEPVIDTKVPFLVIRDLYEPMELKMINLELEFLYRSGTLLDNNTNSAVLPDGTQLKKGQGVFLDNVYTDRNTSIILQLNRKIYKNNDIYQAFTQLDSLRYSVFKICNHDSTLLNYYENNDYYHSHVDEAMFSSITWFFKEPKQFTGGNLRFVDLNITINIENNMCVLFPSYLRHEVEEIKLDGQVGENNGRYSLAQFTMYKIV